MKTADPQQPSGKKFPIAVFLPLVIFLVLAGVFFLMLTADRDPSKIPSALIGKVAPIRVMEPLSESGLPGFSGEEFKGRISVVNVFASWCVPCRQEHPYITALGNEPDVQLIGLNYKDRTTNALTFLAELGNPFDRIGVDPRGRAAIEWGVYGIPETFLIDQEGKIVYKHVGPISSRDLYQEFLPRIAELR